MIKRILLPILCAQILLTHGSSHAIGQNQFLFSSNKPSHIEVNNRIMAVINGKPISAYDLMKKMDVTFYKQFPEYAESVEAKFQFYQYNWKHTLTDLIDKELILADAEEVKIPVSSGEVRQEMETLFGPNIISSLDRAGLSFEEAQKIVQSDLLLQRMMSVRVNLKSLRKVTPQAILEAYEKYSETNVRLYEWDYNIISVRHIDPSKAEETANVIHSLVTNDNVPISELKERLKALGLYEKDTKINISEKFHHTENEVSEKYRDILTTMKVGAFTEPLAHTTRDGNSKIFRIFFLEDSITGGKVPFEELENKLISQLRNKVIDEEAENYLNQLRERFHVNDSEIMTQLPENFEPFILH